MKHLGYIQKLGKLADKSIEFRSDSGTQERNRFWAIQREIIHLVGPEGREVGSGMALQDLHPARA